VTRAVTKMHGAGNDFVVVDCREHPIGDPAAFARRICDRHTGIGADGMIAIEPAAGGIAMRTFNADGSEAEMCGNGVRCAARWLDEAGEGNRQHFETLAGSIETTVIARQPEYLVRVAIGIPRVAPEPVALLDQACFVEVGNPHVVLFRPHADDVDLTMVANRLQSMSAFAHGTNVHVAAVEGDALRVRHWERGVGLTMACGTGAVACAAAAIDRGLLHSPVELFVPGGRLVVEWDGRGTAYLTGPAVRVFDACVGFEVGVPA
jgi:diaminopimelate epimerase